MDLLDRLLKGTLSLDDLVRPRDEDAVRAEMARLAARSYALPRGEDLFLSPKPTPAELREMMASNAWRYYVAKLWAGIYDTKMSMGVGDEVVKKNALAEGLSMFIDIFDDMEREIFPEDDVSPGESTPQEGES